jgi:hypothetical protein
VEDGGNELARLTIEDQERVGHVLAAIAVLGHALLLAMRRIGGTIDVEDDVGRDAVPLPLLRIDLQQRCG